MHYKNTMLISFLFSQFIYSSLVGNSCDDFHLNPIAMSCNKFLMLLILTLSLFSNYAFSF